MLRALKRRLQTKRRKLHLSNCKKESPRRENLGLSLSAYIQEAFLAFRLFLHLAKQKRQLCSRTAAAMKKIKSKSKVLYPRFGSGNGPLPMHEVVVIAVSAAVMAATRTFRISSQMLDFFMIVSF